MYQSKYTIFAPAPASPTLLTNLRGYWKLDETTGNLIDSVGLYNADGSIIQPVSQGVSGKMGNSIQFGNASTGYVTCGNTVANVSTNDFTITGWIYPTYIDTYNQICGNALSGDQRWWHIFLFGDGRLMSRMLLIASQVTSNIDSSLKINNWYHFASTFKRDSSIRMYLNGVLQNDSANAMPYDGSIWSPSNIFTIGSMGEGIATQLFKGKIDELGLWDRLLTSDEISTIYNNGNGLSYPFTTVTAPSFLTTDGSTIAWYDYSSEYVTLANTADVSEWRDKSGHNYHLFEPSLNSRPTWNIINGIVFDGSDDRLDNYTMDTSRGPKLFYAVIKNVSWNEDSYIWDNDDAVTGSGAFNRRNLLQAPIATGGVYPMFSAGCGSTMLSSSEGLLPGNWGILRVLYYDNSSYLRINAEDLTIKDAGTWYNLSGGLVLGSRGRGGTWPYSTCSNIAFKEIIIRNHDDDSINSDAVYTYLKNRHGTQF
jgi:hypothetical protein